MQSNPTQAPPGHENIKILPHIPYIQDKPFTPEQYRQFEERVLDNVSAELERRNISQAPLDEARLNLAQAELARQALVRRVPMFIAALVLASTAVLALAAVLLGVFQPSFSHSPARCF